MKRILAMVMGLMLMITLSGCTEAQHEHDYTVIASEKSSTCLEKGERVMKCNKCNETVIEELPLAGHTVSDWSLTREPTADEFGEVQGVCSICHETVLSTVNKLGYSTDYPLKEDAKKFYRAICNGKFVDYKGKYIQLSGKVTYISSYSDMIGYYLYGEKGQGVCCWVYSSQTKKQLANVGDIVTFAGIVQNEGVKHVELTYCKLITE